MEEMLKDLDWDWEGLIEEDNAGIPHCEPSASSKGRKRKSSQAEPSHGGNRTDPAQLEAQKRWRLKKLSSMQVGCRLCARLPMFRYATSAT